MPQLEGDVGRKVDYTAVINRVKSKITNRATAMRAHCVECSCGVLSEVRNCPVTACSLWPFRMGEDPFRKKRTGFAGRSTDTDEQED